MQFDLMWLKAKKFLSKNVSMLKARSSAKKEIKRINFTFANESPRRTFEQFDDLQKRAYFFDQLTDIKDGKASWDEVVSFLDFILQESIPKGNPRVVVQARVFAYGQDTCAQFVPFKNKGEGYIEISSRNILEFLGGERDFLDLIISLGHERQHYFQNIGKLKAKNFSEKKFSNIDESIKQVFADFDKDDMHWTEIGGIIALLLSDMNEEFVKTYNKTTSEEKMQFQKLISHSMYAQSKAEEDARAGGIAFAKQFVEFVTLDEMCDSYTRKWLVSQLSVIEEYAQQEKETRENYYLYNDFQESLSEVSAKRIAEIGENISNKLDEIDFLNPENSNKNLSKFKHLAMDTYRNVVSIYLWKKTRDELVEMLCDSVKNHHIQFGLATKFLLSKNSSTNKNDTDLLSNKIEEIFSTEEMVSETILSFGDLLSPEQSLKLMGKFLKENKIRFAICLCCSNMSKSTTIKHIAYNSIFKNAEQMFEKFERGDKDVVLGDFLYLSDFVNDFDIDYDFGKELGKRGGVLLHKRAERLLKRLEKNKEKMLETSEVDAELQEELTERIYGKKEVKIEKKWVEERKEWKKFSQEKTV